MKGLMFMNTAVCLAALSGTALAQNAEFELPRASAAYIGEQMPLYLAANDIAAAVKKSASAAPEIGKSDFEPAIFSASNAHGLMGLGAVVLAGLAAVTAPEGCEDNCTAATPRETNGTHAQLAKASVALAAAAITVGLIEHWDDFHLEDGITDPDNLHVLLGVTGAAMMAYAVNKSANSSVEVSHAGTAEAGALGMLVAIKLTW